MTDTPTDKKLSERALTARDALVLSVPEKGFGNERANVTIENLAKVGWVLVPRYSSPGPSGYSPDEFALSESRPSAIREAERERDDLAESLRECSGTELRLRDALSELAKLRERTTKLSIDYTVALDEKGKALDELARVKHNLEGRDQFIVDRGLWQDFCEQLT